MWASGGEKFGGGGGGGFVPGGGGNFASPRGGGFDGGDKGKGGRRSQNIVPVTIRQLIECTEETLKIEDTEVHVVTIVGLVRAVETTTTKVAFVMDDQTATIEAINYVGTDGDGVPDTQTILSEGSYGRVVGQLRTQKGSKYVIIFKVFPVTDMNELTCHSLEVLQVPIRLKRLREQEASRTGVGLTNDMNNTLTTSMMGSSFSDNKNVSGPGGGGINGLNMQQTMVYNVLKGCRDEKGLHKDQIAQNLKNKMTPKEIMNAIEFLSGEGHIFSTVDDDHYKCTDW